MIFTIPLQRAVCTFLTLVCYVGVYAADINYTSWKFNNLYTIGGIDVSPEGDPRIITINSDSAYRFDGVEDRVVIDSNPLIGLVEFTVEVVFRVDKGGIAEQKFLHLQASPDIRILFELEFSSDSTWYMENYIKSGNGNDIHLLDTAKLHAVNRWYHAAMVYKDNEFRQYINYKPENTGHLPWISPNDGSVSVGARMNQESFMTGAVREIRFTDAALDSSQFLLFGELLEQHETFILDNLTAINGHIVEPLGNPAVVETDIGPGIEFDGAGDGIYILTNPIDSAKYFTIETIVKPSDVYPSNIEPRYFHIEDGDDSNRRITMELRLNDKHEWYFDGFLKATASESVGLMDETLTHPIDSWEHMAITYDNGLFRTYVNYTRELERNWGPNFLPLGENTKMSVGMRMNQVHYFNGIIQRIRITHAVLDTCEFMPIYSDPDTSTGDTATLITEGLPNSPGMQVTIFPNPAGEIARIHIMNSTAGFISIELYTMTGNKVSQLINAYVPAGITETSFNAGVYEKGIYLIRTRNQHQIQTEKILIL